jgi:hypothetical protein
VSDSNKVVQVTGYKVSVAHHFENSKLELTTPYFSEIDNYYSNTKRKGVPVKQQLSLSTLLERLNTIKDKLSKNNSIAILKGLYKGGTSGAYCYEASPFLFIDIDVNKKKKENIHLLDAFENAKVFEQIKEIAVIAWRSYSGDGIAGILFVPKLVEITHKDTKKHLEIGRAICSYLQDNLKVNAKFDDAQNKFRQVRYLALQQEKRSLNLNPFVFDFDVSEILKLLNSGAKQYRYENNRTPFGSIEYQFNQDHDIHTALIDNGFTRISANRYKHPRTNSRDTGEVANNLFFNYSSSFSNHTVFSPYRLYLTERYNDDKIQFHNYLKKKGYHVKKPNENIFKTAKKNLKVLTEDREKQIFEACFDLENATYKEKLCFVNENAATAEEEIYFYDYLKLKKLNIPYDEALPINDYVSERIENILDSTDTHQKIIVSAETGTGKTTAFVKEFHKHRPSKRLIILAPLTAIVDQIKEENNSIISLTGDSSPSDHTKAKTATLVVATYEQGCKHLKEHNTFDYVVIDEVHNLITANSFKSETITNLTYVLESYRVIGLTGTVNILFKAIGYRLISIKKNSQTKVDVNFIIDNRPPLKIALQHLKNVQGKCILRVNSKEVAKALEIELINSRQYNKDEILILYSDSIIKNREDYKHLIAKGEFNKKKRLVITTSLIDEGLSIRQKGFTDVVFIETEYNPMTESLKQFFARFRNPDQNRKNYFYYRETNNQNRINFDPYYDFDKTKKKLSSDSETLDVNETNKKDISNTKYLYYDDNTINDYQLAFDTSDSFFKILTTEEYIYFLETNYNINFIVNNEYRKIQIDTNKSKEVLKKEKNIIATSWLNQKDEILDALYDLTDDSEIKKTIAYMGMNPSDDIYELVSNNLKFFGKLQRSGATLEQLGVKNVDDILINKQKMIPNSQQNINRKIKLHQNLDTIQKPKTKTDEINKTKMLNFIDAAGAIQNHNKSSILRLWKKQRSASKNFSYYNLIDLIEYFKN